MPLTTPPRPYDILALFPELAAFARTAVRLHPRHGNPSIGESSVGGPLLWPADEPWPMCALEHEDLNDEPLDYIRAEREFLRERDRREELGEKTSYEGNRDRLHELRLENSSDNYPDYDEDAPQPLIPVAQLYYRDVPGLPWADRYDLLQILWCPRDHPDADTPFNPVFELRWRRAEQVTATLSEPPRPVICASEYVPNVCVVHPESVTEYPNTSDLPEPLAHRILEWAEKQDLSAAYNWNVAFAPGWKVMGHGGIWGIIDPHPIVCDCGAEQLPLFTAASGEFDGGTRSWRPIEEAGTGYRHSDPVEVVIGRGYTLQLYYCPESEHHPGRTEMF
ncbi:hypothetical protein [Glycomyces arizonensis]|uniref:hypothetical protein n=1 Tax=Glycomyces arizonensis TaxID=256035 RepID=UPI00055283C5|nr:hypothetical protein [Glycomyces arizonensis]